MVIALTILIFDLVGRRLGSVPQRASFRRTSVNLTLTQVGFSEVGNEGDIMVDLCGMVRVPAVHDRVLPSLEVSR